MGKPARQRTITIVVSLTLSTALALSTNLATSVVDLKGWWGGATWLAVGALVVAAVLVQRRDARTVTSAENVRDDVDAAVERLANEVKAQWQKEIAFRGVAKPLPLRVRWSSTSRPVSAGREVVMDEPAGSNWQEAPLHGDLDEVVATYRTLPHGQLVVLGDPGAGKSILAMLLTVKLIEQRQATDPIPVLLQAASGDFLDGVEKFVVQRLQAEYEYLARRHEDGRTHAEILVAQRRVLPIFDGLDELPVDWHVMAIRFLDELASTRGRLVVICRGHDYEQAVTSSGSLLSRAAVIEIEPIGVGQVVDFLRHSIIPSRWTPIFDYLTDHSDGPLAQVLSTPLMISLARTAYQAPNTRPEELLELKDEESIRRRLLRDFTAGAYENDPPMSPSDRATRTRRRTFHPDLAARYLGFLAYHLYQAGTRDLRWWQLSSAVTAVRPDRARFMVPALATVAAVLTTRFGVSLVAGPDNGNLAAVVVLCVIMAGLLDPLFRYLGPFFVSPRSERLFRTFAPVGVDVLLGVLIGLLLDDMLLGLLCGLAQGALAAVLPDLSVPLHERGATSRMSVDHLHRGALRAAVQYGLAGGVLFTIGASIASGAPAPWEAALLGGVILGGCAAWQAGLKILLWFRLNHLLLAVRGRLPLRFWFFLNDAHRRGTLRRVGTTWQFRHALLQDYLAPQVHRQVLEARAEAGDEEAANLLVDLLVMQGGIDLVKDRARAGDRAAAHKLPDLLARFGRRAEAIALLRQQADDGDDRSAWRLVELLAIDGQVDELWERAAGGDVVAANELLRLPSDHELIDQVIARFREWTAWGGWAATEKLTQLLVVHGQVADAITWLRDRVGVGESRAAARLAEVLATQGRLEEALPVVAELASSGDERARNQLPCLLVALGRVDDAISSLQAHAADGKPRATRRLGELLLARNRTTEAIPVLRSSVNRGDRRAAHYLERLFIGQGRSDEAIAMWRSLAATGDLVATTRLADLLVRKGDVESALDLARAAVRTNGWDSRELLARMLAEHDRIDELRARAAGGDRSARLRHAEVLAARGRADEAITLLRARADTGDLGAVHRLADLLVERGHAQEAIAFIRVRADAGEWGAAAKLAELLVGQAHLDEAVTVLRIHVDDGDSDVITQLADLLVTTGRIDEAIRILRTYSRDRQVAARLYEVLATEGRVGDLRLGADMGDEQAAMSLVRLYLRLNRAEDAEALLRRRAAYGRWEATLWLARNHT